MFWGKHVAGALLAAVLAGLGSGVSWAAGDGASASTACSGDSDSCEGTYASLFAIAHDHNNPDTTVLHRVSVPAFATGTDWGDGDNGFFYRATVYDGSGSVSDTRDYVPFNGFGVADDGSPELPDFHFIVPVDISGGEDSVSLEIVACVSQYQAESGTTPRCGNSLWDETFTALPSPSVGVPSFGSAQITFTGATSSSLAIPNNGVYPGIITVKVAASSGSLTDDEIDWIFDHLVFFDEDTGVYTNDIFEADGSSHRRAGILSLKEAAYEDPATGKYYTKFGSADAFSAVSVDAERQFFVYTLDTLGSGSFQIGVQYIYDRTDACTGFVNNGPGSIASDCDLIEARLASGSTISPSLSVTPVSGDDGVITAYPLNSETAGYAESRIISFAATQSGATCDSVVNPLAVNQSYSAYNPPNYVIDDDAAANWGLSFPRALYYVPPTGFGNCSSDKTPFCQLTDNYTAYVPHYANSSGTYGTLNGGSTADAIVSRFALADQYAFEALATETSNRLVWFDNCGYGYVYEECAECEYGLGTRETLPDPPDDRDTYIYTITNDLDYPIAFGKECCASWYQQNDQTGAWEPPQEIDNGYAMYIPAGASATYRTLFSSEAMPVYNATTGEQLFKMWLNLDDGAMYGCADNAWSTTIADSAPYSVAIGDSDEGSLSCQLVGSCPFGMDASVDGDTTTCTAKSGSAFILGMPDWAVERAADTPAIQVKAWGARNTGDTKVDGGFALSVLSPGDLVNNLYFYQGYKGSSSIVTANPLSELTSDVAETITDPANVGVMMIAGGAAISLAGGTGAVAIANADPSGDAISTQGGSTNYAEGGNPTPFIGKGGDGGKGTAGTNGIGGFSTGKWNDDESLIPPQSWEAGGGGIKNRNNFIGGGGFGGGESYFEDSGAGGGSWAAANTAYDPTAPTSRPSSPNGDGGALQFEYTTYDCTVDEDSISVTCVLPSSASTVDLGILRAMAMDFAPQSWTIDEDSAMFLRAWGGEGGDGSGGTVGGAHGFAQTMTSLASYSDTFGSDVLYYYIGKQGGTRSSKGYQMGNGGSSSIVASADLDETAPCIAEGDDCSQNILLIAAGGGGATYYVTHDHVADGNAGGQAVATTSGAASGAGSEGTAKDDAYAGQNGVGGKNTQTEVASFFYGHDGIGGMGGSGDFVKNDVAWLNADNIAQIGDAGAGGLGFQFGGGGGGGWGGGGGSSLGASAGGGSYAMRATQDAVLPVAENSDSDGRIEIGWIATETEVSERVSGSSRGSARTRGNNSKVSKTVRKPVQTKPSGSAVRLRPDTPKPGRSPVIRLTPGD